MIANFIIFSTKFKSISATKLNNKIINKYKTINFSLDIELKVEMQKVQKIKFFHFFCETIQSSNFYQILQISERL